MERYCENPLCENEAVRAVAVSIDTPSDQKRALCGACQEAYDWGVQHGRRTPKHKKVWVLAVSHRDTVVHGRLFGARSAALEGLAAYLRANEGYRGPAAMPEISDWLARHADDLGVEIFPAPLPVE